ncbi:hypothetical protein CFC21_024628 [Triticum aestivum]|uniref:DUF3615 domain-containing protein n=2 Tax=Triticum aestivum TaxID=4565 RepID=A0A3B6CCN2_WHEAT|nr:hypothetical protein CFC21_024628 [Triticum aestivum]
MGSFFSSPGADPDADADAVDFPSFDRQRKHERDALAANMYTIFALGHYNSRNPDAMFYPAAEPMEVPRAAWVGFRQDFWYHVGFWARRRDATHDNEQKYFFAELRFERRSRRLVVETCTLLEKPMCRFKSRCAFCPDRFQILHPSDAEEFTCGKKRHKKKFFRERNMLGRPFMLR